MGIPVIDHDDPAGYDNSNTCHACGANKENHPHSATTQSKTTPSSYHNVTSETFKNTAASGNVNLNRTSKDLVGNSKEFRIEHNKCDLRIIGNSNRIRIGCNMGNVQVIGNSTRLKIINNSGSIRYTGNEGRICLGSDSCQQTVDYIGNNGLLKVVDSEQLSAPSKSAKKCSADEKPKAAEATSTSTRGSARKVKAKSASYGGGGVAPFEHFNEMFQRYSQQRFINVSLPDLKPSSNCRCQHSSSGGANGDGVKSSSHSSRSSSKHCKIDNSISVQNSYGNIVIKNAVNVSL